LNKSYEALLLEVQSKGDVDAALKLLDTIYKSVPEATWQAAGDKYAALHAEIHGNQIDDEKFTMRYAA
jgi:hypothetical protein